MPRTYFPLLFILVLLAVGGLAGCTQADNPQIPDVAAPPPPENSKALAIPKKAGKAYGTSSKYEELMNKRFEQKAK